MRIARGLKYGGKISATFGVSEATEFCRREDGGEHAADDAADAMHAEYVGGGGLTRF